MERGWNYILLSYYYYWLVVKKGSQPTEGLLHLYVSDVSHFPLDIDEYIIVLIFYM